MHYFVNSIELAPPLSAVKTSNLTGAQVVPVCTFHKEALTRYHEWATTSGRE